jgi:hypothetical protein
LVGVAVGVLVDETGVLVGVLVGVSPGRLGVLVAVGVLVSCTGVPVGVGVLVSWPGVLVGVAVEISQNCSGVLNSRLAQLLSSVRFTVTLKVNGALATFSGRMQQMNPLKYVVVPGARLTAESFGVSGRDAMTRPLRSRISTEPRTCTVVAPLFTTGTS